MTDLEEFQRRVDAYFQSVPRPEPGGRIILDMMRALREAHELLRGVGANRYWEGRWRDEAAENERLCLQREGLLCRVAELRAENERLHAKIINSGPEDDWEERGAATELRAENERLRAKMRRIGVLNAENLADIDDLLARRGRP